MKSLATLKNFFDKQLRLLMMNLKELEVQRCNILNARRLVHEEICLIQSTRGCDSSQRIELQILDQRIKAYKSQIRELDLEIQLCRNKIVRCYIQLNKIIALKKEDIFNQDSRVANKDFCYNEVWQGNQSLVLI